jgi:hypothetical protein
VPAYARYLASELLKAVGEDVGDGRRKSDGRPGHLCYGPYINIGPGRYAAGFYVQRGPGEPEGEVRIDVCAEHGKRVLARRSAPVKELFSSVDGLLSLDFSVNAVERGCELRLHVSRNARVEVAEAVLFRVDLASWGFR